MDRTLHTKLTLPKYPDLLHRINEMCIAIKLHQVEHKSKEVISALSSHKMPTWEEVLSILTESRTAINEQREDPRNY